MPETTQLLSDIGEAVLNDPQFKKLMYEEKFDLLVFNFGMSEFFVGVAEHFDCPAIMLSGFGLVTKHKILSGNPLEAASVPHYYFLKNSKQMNFLRRVVNFLLRGLGLGIEEYFASKQKQLYK